MQAQEVDIKTTQNFQKLVLENPKPVVVDFYADWCGPCKQLKPFLHDALSKSNGKWVLAKVDVDIPELGDISQQYASEGIPAVYLFVNGKVVGNFLGCDLEKAATLIQNAQK